MSRTKRLSLALATVFAAACASVPALANDPSEAKITILMPQGPSGTPGQSQAGATYRVTARVPVACWVRPDTTMSVDEGGSGSVVEACNNPGGFTISASYRPLTESENAELVYDNRPISLAKSGAQLLRQSSMAVIKRVNYRFQSVKLDQPLVLSLTIQPI